MKTEKEIKKEYEKLKDYYVRMMNGGGGFGPKNKYSTLGKLDILEWILEESEKE